MDNNKGSSGMSSSSNSGNDSIIMKDPASVDVSSTSADQSHDNRVKFHESNIPKDPVMARFTAMEDYTRFYIEVFDERIKLRMFPYSKEGLVQCIKENNLDITSSMDLTLACILVELIKLNILKSSDPSMAVVSESDLGMIPENIFQSTTPITKTVMMVSLSAYVYGVDVDEGLWWYPDLVKVKGNFMTKSNLIHMSKILIASTGSLKEVMNTLTVKDIHEENETFNYRLSKLASPSLIMKATQAMPHPSVIKFFDPKYLDAYREFDKAGILAQIASGSLSKFCRGKVDPLRTENIPGDLKLSQLASFAAPFDPSTIRKATIILDTIGFNYGNWYQSKKVNNCITADHEFFSPVVKAVHELMNIKSDNGEEVEKCKKRIEKLEMFRLFM